jgi:hypothetical protein
MKSTLQELNARWIELMRRGDFAKAWAVSDAAQSLRAGIDCSSWPRHEQFIWNGAPLHGRDVLVRCYHGLGDTIQYLRFLPVLRQIARDVTVWIQPALLPLASYVSGATRSLPLHDGVPNIRHQVDIEISELMHALRVAPEDLAAHVPYIELHPAEVPRSTSKRRVGIVWRAGEWNERRSIACEQLEILGTLTYIDWWVLQRGPGLREWRHTFGHIPDIDNIVDEARVMAELDLLITVDTCSAHLAGAMGIPTWTLLPYEADWRWMDAREDTPWYPSMRLIRQTSAGDWGPVLSRVVAELRRQLPAPGNGCRQPL